MSERLKSLNNQSELDPDKGIQLLKQIYDELLDINVNRLSDQDYACWNSLYVQIRTKELALSTQKLVILKNDIISGCNRLSMPKSSSNNDMKELQKQMTNVIINDCCNDKMVVKIHADGTKTYDPESDKYNKEVAESCGVSKPSKGTLDHYFAKKPSNDSNNKSNVSTESTNNKSKQQSSTHKKNKHYKNPVELHITHSIWSQLFHEGNNYGLGMIYLYTYIFCIYIL